MGYRATTDDNRKDRTTSIVFDTETLNHIAVIQAYLSLQVSGSSRVTQSQAVRYAIMVTARGLTRLAEGIREDVDRG